MSTLRTLQRKIAEINKEKGWYDKPVSFGEGIALIHSEASEALEAFRRIPEVVVLEDGMPDPREKIGLELADIVIRTLDLAERQGIELGYFVDQKILINKKREYRHGGKRL